MYTFFSSSTHRWKVLFEGEGEEADEKMGANIFKFFDRFFFAPPP